MLHVSVSTACCLDHSQPTPHSLLHRPALHSFDCADEIDAIGKARGTGASDSGTAEREQGLLQLLCELDGFKRNDKVLVIGATNRLDSLDDALIRPGRFDRTIYMGRPTTNNRFKILQVSSHTSMLAFEGSRHQAGVLAPGRAEAPGRGLGNRQGSRRSRAPGRGPGIRQGSAHQAGVVTSCPIACKQEQTQALRCTQDSTCVG